MSELEKAAAAAVAAWERDGARYDTFCVRMDALREALAAHRQAEPVACPLGIHPIHTKYCSAQTCDACKAQKAEPVALQPEPVFEIGFGWLVDGRKYPRGTKLYAAPPHQQQAEPVEPVVGLSTDSRWRSLYEAQVKITDAAMKRADRAMGWVRQYQQAESVVEPVVDDLVALVLRMARDLKRAGHPAMADKAVDFLRRKNLQPSPLRADSAGLEQADPVVEQLERQGFVMPPGGDAGSPII